MAFELNIKELNIVTEVNSGRGPQPNPDENKQLAIDYAGMPENGLTMAALVAKYGSSAKNLYDRLERMGVPRHKKPTPKKRTRKVKAKAFYE